MQKIEEITIYNETELNEVQLHLKKGDRIFFYGDLGVGKTTLIRSLLKKIINNKDLIVRSPTYTYYSRFETLSIGPDSTTMSGVNLQIYHFDLYRIENVETFSLIGGDEIWEDPNSVCLIEWPERIEKEYTPTKIVHIEKLGESERKITIRHMR